MSMREARLSTFEASGPDKPPLRPESLLNLDPSRVPEALRETSEDVSLAAYLIVEASRVDGLPLSDVLAWLGMRESLFARAEESWSDRVADELARDGADFDEMYEDLLGQALALWARPIGPLDCEVEAWITFQRHALAADDPGEIARRAGLTPGDEMRLARLWRARLAAPELAAQAAAAWSGPLLPMPKLILSPLVFPPAPGGRST
ncbi:hypothetical protein [Sorangium sp. So ce1151]|uniref:hypothetical protein n=1 Tax=Sorangium sp. So ce1151 TaxID=3133332 RepID=UPI003F5F4877